MSDCMDYPQTLRKFANDYSFKDREEVYTNGSMLVPLFRIEQALDEHFMDIEKVQYKMDTDSAYECGYQQGRTDAEQDDLIKACINQLKESDADEVKVSADTKDGYRITIIVELKEQNDGRHHDV